MIDSFISSRSLLNFSYIFSILVSGLVIFNSILFSRFWIIFTIIILNYFSGRPLSLSLLFGLVGIYPVPLPAEYFSAFSSRLYCCVWGGLSVCWKFVVPLYCGRFLPVGGVGRVACQGFLVREACIGVLEGEAGSLLSGVQ